MRVRKGGSTVGAISAVAVAGIAVATAAIICVLSVFNGFRDILVERDNRITPDVVITPARGKVIADADSLAQAVARIQGVEDAIPVMADNALAIYESAEMPIDLRGVPLNRYPEITGISERVLQGGEYPGHPGNDGIISIGTAGSLRIPAPGVEFLIFAPRRNGRINPANPITSFITDSIKVSGVFRTDRVETDERTVICDINLARRLFQYTTEGTGVEVKALDGISPRKLASEISSTLGGDYKVCDRFMMQEVNFRMINIEKWVSFLLLFFILIIAGFNIISTLCMAVIEKRRSLWTLRALGMSRRTAGAIFGWESMLVSLLGGIIGIILGLALCLIQQHWGIIHLAGDPADLLVRAYPVAVKGWDILFTLIPVVAVGGLTAWVSSRFAASRA